MDDVARLAATDRRDLFGAAARQRGLTPQIIEKDFWVCWTLRRIFGLPTRSAGILFKGGTSLSKVFGIIERFSEDVDLSLDRATLGFGGDKDPMAAATGKKKRKWLDALTGECRRVIRDEFLPELLGSFTAALGAGPSATTWRLEIDPDGGDGQTLLFRYPSIYAKDELLPAYVRPVVRLDLGARADPWPTEVGRVTPYAAEALPHLFKDPQSKVRVLSVARTFWEKATILHMWYHAPEDKHFRDRQSRHYYDMVKLWERKEGKRAAADLNLLRHVAQHKSVFFASAAAQYDLAKPGTLRLVPPGHRMQELEADFQKMREMIFGTPPDFARVIQTLKKIEAAINAPTLPTA